ncbi:hypothetical protein GCM10008904_24680 [Paraclostridium ghonii]|uniref:Uncharacterized protein n=1 Tax=Paraclostridium ghonii TaxID=29358 RepID=A0ABU0MZ49_9FIRM|nr:hypothetical protein [Paeniclostridium ghonii]MDQ0556180.1 hypothetical protein [Paeniclostridium ghonii]
MEDLLHKIDEIKENLQSKDIKSIKKSKLKTISTKEINKDNKQVIITYNYYVKLTKKIKKYLKTEEDIIFEVKEDDSNRIICLIVKLIKSEIEIFMPIDIRVFTGDTKDTYMDCSYYNLEDGGTLYIKEFTSGKPNHGYGKIILENLDYIVEKINMKLDSYNHYFEDYKFNYIKKIEGVAIPSKSIITQEVLNKIYRKYGFEVDEQNNMSITKIVENKEIAYNQNMN